MATMHATAVITAVDRASPVFMRVAQVAHNAANVYTGLAGRLDAVHSALRNLGTITALPGVMALGAIVTKTQEMEKALVGVQIAGIGDNIRERVVDYKALRENAEKAQEAAFNLSKAMSLPPVGFVKAAEAAMKMGLNAEKAQALMNMAGYAKINDPSMTPEKATEFLGSMGILFGAGTEGRDYSADMARLTGQWVAVANLARTNLSRMEDGLRQFAPLWSSLGVNFGDTAALLGAASQAGINETEMGTAYKSLALRFLNMTHQGRDAMNVSGLWNEIQKRGLIEMSATSARQAMLNMSQIFPGRIGKGDQRPLRDLLEEGQKGNLYMDAAYQNRLFALVNKITGARDAPTMEANQEKVLTAILTGGGKIKMPQILELMREMMVAGKLSDEMLAEIDQGHKLTEAQLAKIGEGRHLSRYTALFKAWGEFKRLQKAAHENPEIFLEASRKVWNESEAGRWEATLASMERAFVRFRQSEGIRSTIGLLEQFASTIASMPQGMVEFGGKALVASVGIGAMGLALAGVAKAAVVIAGNPLLKALFLGGGALGLFQPDAFMGYDPFGNKEFMAGGAPILETLGRLKQVGEEAAQTAQLIGGIATEIVQAIQVAFGEDPANSPLFKGLQSFNDLLTTTADRIRNLREMIAALASGEFGSAMEKLKGVNPQGFSFAEFVMKGGITGWAGRQLFDPGSGGMLRDLRGGVDRVEVNGQADVKVQNEITIRVDGPGTVIDNKPGTANVPVPLNTGPSMPDTAR